MVARWKGTALVGVLVFAAPLIGQLATKAQQPRPIPDLFAFQVVECFDARYLGDSPGHLGRGSLAGARLDVALGDPVYRGDLRVGKITGLTWDRVKENLEVEFDPEPFEFDAHGRPVRPVRIGVGQDVWIPMGGMTPAAPAR